jgi:ABC-type antimicrobial peptide transport system permease subunit
VDALGGRRLPGRVSFVALVGVDNGGVVSFPVRVSLTPNGAVKPGMNVSVRIAVAKRPHVVRVPLEAVSGDTVTVVGTNGVTAQRHVVLGLADNKPVEIRSGLRAGEHVLLAAKVAEAGAAPLLANNRGVSRGRPITSSDIAFGRSVALVGPVPGRKLFPGRNPIGGTLRIGGHEFEVVGVLQPRGKLGLNLDNQVLIPLPIATRVLLGGSNTRSIDVQMRTEQDVNPAMDEIGVLLRKQQKLPTSHPDDFSIEDQAQILKTARSASTTFRVLTFALGGIALIVGGIGIMNMMLVSVHERTREIGIRKSVGADPLRVQMQFLIEAVVLSTLGGIAGVFGGIGATHVIGSFAGWQTLVNPGSVVLAFLVALVVRLFLGYYPARRPARLDPIAALRYE